MAATGNVVEDLKGIREALVPREHLYMYKYHVRDGLVPWAPPASELAIRRLIEEIPAVPQDLLDLFSVTEIPAAGILDFEEPIGAGFEGSFTARSEVINDNIMPLAFIRSDEIYRRTNRTHDNDDGWVPNGDLFWFQVGNDHQPLGMAIGGPNHERVYTMNLLWGIQRIAYRLRDVVACTRDLYENGWFHYFDHPDKLVGPKRRHDPIELEERVAELVTPVIDHWHCSPKVACLGRHTEPTPPPDL